LKKLKLKELGLGVLILVSGCAGSPPLEFYTLSSMSNQENRLEILAETHPLSVAIAPIEFPDFLDRSQIVTRPSPNTLKMSEFHRWGGSLSSDFLRVLGENLSILLGTERIFYPRQTKALPIDYRLTLNVKAFEGEIGKEVVLDVDWIIIDQQHEGVAMMQNTVIREPVQRSDYESFVAAQSRALAVLSHRIASAIGQSSIRHNNK
jgi:uncharacterized lipoprotein YmbA